MEHVFKKNYTYTTFIGRKTHRIQNVPLDALLSQINILSITRRYIKQNSLAFEEIQWKTKNQNTQRVISLKELKYLTNKTKY